MASGLASSGKNEAVSDSPYEKKVLDSTKMHKPSATCPGPTSAKAAVLITHPAVTHISKRFLPATRSAHAPNPGMVSMTIK